MRARALRRQMTPGEVRLWQRLRRRQLGMAFKRQRPIGPYVADLYCADLQLVVEVDGESHREKGPEDLERQRYLEEALHVLRFEEPAVCRNPDGVVQRIRDAAEPIGVSHPPPPPGEVSCESGTEGVPRGDSPASPP